MDKIVLIICLTLSSASLSAQELKQAEPEPIVDMEISSEPQKTTPILSRSRGYLGKSYIDLTQTIDGFLAGKHLDREYNESFLKLLTQSTVFERSDTEYGIKLKGKLDLPGTMKRFRLFIDSDPDVQKSIEDRNRSIARGERVNERSAFAGIEFAKRKPLTRWKTSYSLGARTGGEFRLLSRARLRKHWMLGENWTSYFHQDIWYLDGTGWGETSRSEFTRSLGGQSWIQFLTELEYQDDNPAWQYIHSWRVDQILNKSHALTYKIGITGDNPDGLLEDNRFISFSWRSRIYEDWAFLHLTPEVYFSSEDEYKPEAAFTIKLELFLTD